MRPTSHHPAPPASPNGSPYQPTARPHPPAPGAEGPAEQYRPQAHAVAMATRPFGGGGAHAVAMETPGLRRPARTKPRGGRVGTVLRLRARGSGRKVSPRPPPPPFSAGRSVTRTEVERSRPRGLGRRGPERPAAGGRGPRGAADRTHGKAGSPGGAPASRAWAPSLLFTSPPAAGRRPSSWGHRMAVLAAVRPTLSAQEGKGAAPRPGTGFGHVDPSPGGK